MKGLKGEFKILGEADGAHRLRGYRSISKSFKRDSGDSTGYYRSLMGFQWVQTDI